jgi:mono/diheme cytochrome c family protein
MVKRFTLLAIAFILFSALLVACGGGDNGSSATSGDPDRGKALYNQTIIGPNAAPGCVTCHSLDPGKTLVGPSHAGLATRAESAASGTSAEDYLRESIVTPDAHVTEGFTPGVMYQNYGKDLTEQEINDLVAYLMTLK